MFHTLYFLIILMTLAGNQYDCTLTGECHSCTYRLTAVGDVKCACTSLFVKTRLHIGADILRLLKSGIVGCEYQTL